MPFYQILLTQLRCTETSELQLLHWSLWRLDSLGSYKATVETSWCKQGWKLKDFGTSPAVPSVLLAWLPRRLLENSIRTPD